MDDDDEYEYGMDDIMMGSYYAAICYAEDNDDDNEYDGQYGYADDDSSIEQDYDTIHQHEVRYDSEAPSTDDDDEESVKSLCNRIVYGLINFKAYMSHYKYPRNCIGEYIPDDNVTSIANAIRKNTSVTILGFKGFLFTTKGFTILLEGIAENQTIEQLRFRGRISGNQLFEFPLVEILANKLRANAFHFTNLVLERSKMGWIGVISIFETLLSNIIIEDIDMSRTIERDTVTGYPRDVINNSSLQQPNSPDTRPLLLRQLSGVVARVLECTTTLTTLDLSCNPLGDEFVVIIADVVRTNKTLRQLCLRGIDMTDVGITALANAVKYNTVIDCLMISKNTYSGTGVIAMGEALKYNKTIEYLYMNDHMFRNNPALRPEDIDYSYLASFFHAMEYNTTIQTVDIFEPYLDYERYMPQDIQQRIVQSLVEYNDTIDDLHQGMKSAPKEVRHQIKRAKYKRRIAYKKGGHERRIIYNWILHN